MRNGKDNNLNDFIQHDNKIKWNFDCYGDTEGWLVPERMKGTVMGGALCIKIDYPERVSEEANQRERNQIYPGKCLEIVSPKGLNLSLSKAKTIKMRILNLSPETDGVVSWTHLEQPDRDAGIKRFFMTPYSKEWQEIVCSINEGDCSDTIDQIHIAFGLLGCRGDIIIDWIAVTDDEKCIVKNHPDINSSELVPIIELDEIKQSDFKMAFDILDECLVTDVPVKGFSYPFIAPGGCYGPCWWQLDTSLALCGAKWVNQKFAEDVIRGFIDVQKQNPDGRIDLWGGSPIRGSVGDISSLPKYIEVAYDIVRRSENFDFWIEAYGSMRKYLDWWLSPVKRDKETGLVTGVFEESFGVFNWKPQTIAQVDLNVEVAAGSYCVSEMAERLGYGNDKVKYRNIFLQLKNAINNYLWDDERGAYYSYDVKQKILQHELICSTFDVFRLGIAPPERVEILIAKLLEPDLFNWSTYPLTSVAKTDKTYVEAVGPYDGRAWNGDIWTLRNVAVIKGLEDIGRYDLASELAWRTIKIFNANYAEFLKPSNGEGHGVSRYAWTASQYIETVIEHIFGIDYDGQKRLIRITSNIPKELFGKNIALNNVILPINGGIRLNLAITETNGDFTSIAVKAIGNMGGHFLEIALPYMGKIVEVEDVNNGQKLLLIEKIRNCNKLYSIKIPMNNKIDLRFKGGCSNE